MRNRHSTPFELANSSKLFLHSGGSWGERRREEFLLCPFGVRQEHRTMAL